MNHASLQHAIAAASGGGMSEPSVRPPRAGATWSSFVVHDTDAAFELTGSRDVHIRSIQVVHANTRSTATLRQFQLQNRSRSRPRKR